MKSWFQPGSEDGMEALCIERPAEALIGGAALPPQPLLPPAKGPAAAVHSNSAQFGHPSDPEELPPRPRMGLDRWGASRPDPNAQALPKSGTWV